MLNPETERATLAALRRFEAVVGDFIEVRIPSAPLHAWQKFSTLPEATQGAILSGIRAQTDFVQAAMDEGLEAVDERAMLRWAMRKLSLISDSDVSSEVDPGDVVEIFDEDHIQIYRSYSCFALCNYSLLELVSYPWFELYERSSSITNMFLERMPKLFEGKTAYISYADLSEYTLRELMTEQRSVFGVKERFMARMISAASGKTCVLSVKKVREFPSRQGDGAVSFL
jgi:hypothetical protein